MGHNQKSLSPFLLHHCQFWTRSGGHRGTPGSPARLSPGSGSHRRVRTGRCAHPSSPAMDEFPPKETFPEHTALASCSHHIPPPGQGPAQPMPQSRDLSSFALNRVPIIATSNTKREARHRAAHPGAGCHRVEGTLTECPGSTSEGFTITPIKNLMCSKSSE